MITGPLAPALPMWMCAMVPTTPSVLTLPLTVLSSFTVIVPLPEDLVVTGGTSSEPLSFTLSPVKNPLVESHAPLIVSQPESARAAAAISMVNTARIRLDIVIRSSYRLYGPWKWTAMLAAPFKRVAWRAGHSHGPTILQVRRDGLAANPALCHAERTIAGPPGLSARPGRAPWYGSEPLKSRCPTGRSRYRDARARPSL